MPSLLQRFDTIRGLVGNESPGFSQTMTFQSSTNRAVVNVTWWIKQETHMYLSQAIHSWLIVTDTLCQKTQFSEYLYSWWSQSSHRVGGSPKVVELTPITPDIWMKSLVTPMNFGSTDGPVNSGMQVISCFESFKMCFTQLETHFTKSKPWGKINEKHSIDFWGGWKGCGYRASM